MFDVDIVERERNWRIFVDVEQGPMCLIYLVHLCLIGPVHGSSLVAISLLKMIDYL